jgi:pyridoxal phosphate enzyme (YggS family)
MSETELSYRKFLQQFNEAVEKSGRKKEEIILIAVSKTQSIEKIKAVFQAGHRQFGENYVQEALDKQDQLVDLKIAWHFIGGLQKNKVKLVVGRFELIHSVDDIELARKISNVALAKQVEQKCLLQINIGDESSKGGFSPESILNQLEGLFALPNIRWQGLMAMPPITGNELMARGYLKATKNVFQKIWTKLNDKQKKEWVHLSMGTSHDFVWAIEEGATQIRIGTLIFGERQKKL